MCIRDRPPSSNTPSPSSNTLPPSSNTPSPSSNTPLPSIPTCSWMEDMSPVWWWGEDLFVGRLEDMLLCAGDILVKSLLDEGKLRGN
eukprot:11268489-Ditylum_brightwellii.AAC.1